MLRAKVVKKYGKAGNIRLEKVERLRGISPLFSGCAFRAGQRPPRDMGAPNRD